jgi:molybdate transport system ATP-binding protein
VTHVEVMADRSRVSVGAPIHLTAEVTSESVAALNVEVGSEIWVSIKATEIGVQRS